MKQAIQLAVVIAFSFCLAAPSAHAVFTLVAISALYAFQETLAYFDARNTRPSKSLEELTAELGKLVKDVEDSKNKISSLSMTAGIRNVPTKNPFAR